MRDKATRLRETVNEYGTPVVEYFCETCEEKFTICPAPTPDEDRFHRTCGARECASYDPRFDVGLLFEGGDVAISKDGQLIPCRVIDGGRS